MKIETLKKIEIDPVYKKGVDFIYSLMIDKKLNRQINLQYINVNDWYSNLYPSVYIHNKDNPIKVKKYRRFSNFDLKNAIKFHFKKDVKNYKTVYSY